MGVDMTLCFAQSLDKSCGVDHMPTPEDDDGGARRFAIALTNQNTGHGWTNGRDDQLD
jgi:hypothetical protein